MQMHTKEHNSSKYMPKCTVYRIKGSGDDYRCGVYLNDRLNRSTMMACILLKKPIVHTSSGSSKTKLIFCLMVVDTTELV